MCLQNFTVTAQAKNVQKKTFMLFLVIIVSYQNVKVLFTLNVMEKESKLALAYLGFRKITRKREDGQILFQCIGEKEQVTTSALNDESKKYFVCEHHFREEEIRVSLGIGRKILKPGVIASMFNFKNPSKIKPRKSPKEMFTTYK